MSLQQTQTNPHLPQSDRATNPEKTLSPLLLGQYDKNPESLVQWVYQLGLEPIAYVEDGGDENFYYEIRPTESEIGAASSLGDQPIPWHTDNSCLAFSDRPDYLILGCVDPGEFTTEFHLCSLDDILKLLVPWTKQVLKEPNFIFQTPPSFSRGGYVEKIHAQSILTPNEDAIAFNLDLVTATGSSENYALELLREVLDQCAQPMSLEAGQCIAFDNRTMIHRRGQPSPGRLLHRVYGVRDKSKISLNSIHDGVYLVQSITPTC